MSKFRQALSERWTAAILALVAIVIIWGTYPTGPVYVYDGIKTELLVGESQYTESIAAWKIEVARRFPTALIVFSHGGAARTALRGSQPDWYLGPEVEGMIPTLVRDKAAELVRLYPNRVIVFISCNPSHIRLHGLPNVYYALDTVWQQTDKSGRNGEAIQAEPNVVGNVFEFVEAI
jgi:hypothetical protein